MKQFLYLITALLFTVISCEQSPISPEPSPGDPAVILLSGGGEQVIEASNEFGFDIFNAVLQDEATDKNVFISPTSISLALAMTYNGANGYTEDSMAYALRMDHLSSDLINLTYKELMEGLENADEKVLMSIANSIWYKQGFNVEQGFLEINELYYRAEVAALDFSAPDAHEIINAWVSEKTNDKIPTILDRIDAGAVMYLINAIYFKGIWAQEFNPESTIEESFRLTDGSYKTVDMMAKQDTIGYFENDLFQMAELDYGRGNYSMLVMLPKDDLSPENLALQLSTTDWNNWMSSVSLTEVKLSLPRFTFEYEKELNDILSAMGMGIAFQPLLADFTGIRSTGGLYIGYVKHKTFVEVNEEGTEAAAVTVVAIIETSIDPEPQVRTMTCNKPFLFAIREKTTNAIVFIGKVAEPKTE